jgi:hypothetical protein
MAQAPARIVIELIPSAAPITGWLAIEATICRCRGHMEAPSPRPGDGVFGTADVSFVK